MRPLHRAGTLALFAFALAGCGEAPTAAKSVASRGGRATLSLADGLPRPSARASAALASSGLALDRVRITIVRPESDTLKDTTVAFTSADTALTLNLTVDASVGEQLAAGLEYRAGNSLLFSGSAVVTARAATSKTGPANAPFVLKYVGPGATARRLVVNPGSGSFTSAGTIQFEAIAIDSSGLSIGSAPVEWSVSDTTLGSITAAGVFHPSGKRGTQTVIATTLGGVSGDAAISLVPPTAKVIVVSGGGQTGQVAHALPQPLVIEVQGADGLPLPGQSVVFFANAGSISPLTATTDGSGRAHAVMTLGPAVGTATYSAVSAGFPASATETATVGPATRLAFAQQPTTTTSSKALSPSVSVQIQDSCGNLITNGSSSVTLAFDAASTATGATLGGTLTSTAVNGVATFSNVTVDRTGTAYRLAASASGLITGTSSTFDIDPGPLRLLAVGDTTFSMTAGRAPANPPYAHVVDQTGADVRAVLLHVTVHKGTALLAEFNAPSDAGGKFTASDAVVTVAGTYTVEISNVNLVGSPLRFNVTVLAADPATYTLAVSNTRPTAGSSVTVTASLSDAYGNAVATSGKIIAWSSTNGGTFSSSTGTTGADGKVTVSFTSSPQGGVTHVLTASDGVLKGSYYDLMTVAP